MHRSERLRERRRFTQVVRQGRGWSNRLLVVKMLPNGLLGSRFGFLVGKRVGKAVTRNKVKRRLREVIRNSHIKPGWDIVFIARYRTANVDYHSLKEAVEHLARGVRLTGDIDHQPYNKGFPSRSV